MKSSLNSCQLHGTSSQKKKMKRVETEGKGMNCWISLAWEILGRKHDENLIKKSRQIHFLPRNLSCTQLPLAHNLPFQPFSIVFPWFYHFFFVPYPYQTFISAPSIRFPGFSFPLSVSIKVVAASFTSAWFPSICPLQKTNNVCVRTQETCLCIYSKFKVLLCKNEEKLKKIFHKYTKLFFLWLIIHSNI